AKPVIAAPSESDFYLVSQCLQASDRTAANLAFLGDKYFLFNEERTGFVMFRDMQRSWIALGDPVGVTDVRRELVWAYRQFCDSHDGLCVFYQVSKNDLPNYIEVGLHLYKLGEEAVIWLDKFSLKGVEFKSLRSAARKLEKEGFNFEVVPILSVPEILPELQVISDQWKETKASKEKGFSVGFFSCDYIKRFPVAIVTKEGKIHAFANVWLGGTKKEISVDLMRYGKDSPNGVMDYLFIQLMLWGKERRYERFNLGMAPLSGLENRPLAPLWNRTGALIYSYGESFYNFDGLYKYKDKFSPTWEPKYLACNARLMLPKVLADIASLIRRGPNGLISSS
ncbi:MAG: bifunctional lysylphosphatidylglycerol flippase/synthetase MprF, partial [SAR324 cluster bacterium]|nr:bifunctional lysylphosphatidylglycerol flippase/synthetase MprF [SAR324 cluster bacterium]